jgi:phosphatidate phosphatase APP1
MRAPIHLLLALLTCSCATGPCGDSVPKLRPHGWTVISDIDDTIKDTHVKIGQTHIPNPAIVLDGLRTWHPVAGMASLYHKYWGPFTEVGDEQRNRFSIIYLSAGPCRYDKRLRGNILEWCFPQGKIVLRRGGPIPPRDYKIRAISAIIEGSDEHNFVLVGDSGEHDPESYGEIARRYPRQVVAIYIRDISADKSCRYERAFCGVAPTKIHFLPADVRKADRMTRTSNRTK